MTALTADDLRKRFQAAQERRRKAAATEARLRREILSSDRKLAAQQKITLGAALLRAAEAHKGSPTVVPQLRKLLSPHITRPADRACLSGTAFEMEAPHDEG